MNPTPDDLRAIYFGALDACAPSRLVTERLSDVPFSRDAIDFFAVGKCAEELARGVLSTCEVRRGLILVPGGYSRGLELPNCVERVEGTHPMISPSSVAAARAAIAFACESDRPVLVMVSGGASASVEAPLEPWFSFDQVASINARLVRSGLDIEAINTVRKHVSAVKGGRLGALLPAGSVALIHSDVARGRTELVGSGLVVPDPSTNEDAAGILEAFDDDDCRRAVAALRGGSVPDTPKALLTRALLIADNGTLVDAACAVATKHGLVPARADSEVEGDVEDAARTLADRAISLREGEILVAGGEPTVTVRGAGRGGRCSELAVRVARRLPAGFIALFGSSDGVDGSSPAGAVVVTAGLLGQDGVTLGRIDDALGRSASYDLIGSIGEAIIMEPTGNNLRDIFLVARGSGHAS